MNLNDPEWLAAWYAQLELKIKTKLAINAGVRLDYINPFGASVSPRIAAVYRLTPKNSLKYIFGQAFRAPNANENWYQDGIVIGPHPAPLHPENIQSQDVLFESRLTGWGELIGEFYYNRLTNLIDLSPNPETGLLAFANVSQYRSRGIGVEFDVHTKGGVRAQASYMLADADSTQGGQLAADPVNIFKLTASAPARKWLVAGVEVQALSSQYTLLNTRIPGTVLANLTFSTPTLWNAWQFSASCYNLFDRDWSLPAGPSVSMASIPQDGRNFRFKVTYRLPLGASRRP